MSFNPYIISPQSLVTTHEETRTGFLKIALEKNKVSDPYVKNALAFRTMANSVHSPEELLLLPNIRPFLITASGLSEKSLKYLTEDDQTIAIQELIEKFLKPAGKSFLDEAIYRYLLIKGDAVGGIMRNRIGVLAEEQLIRALYASMSVRGTECDRLPLHCRKWQHLRLNMVGIESNVKALHWKNKNGSRILILNANIPTVEKNVDICLFQGGPDRYEDGKIVRHEEYALMFGELKGGIDPAGADEHWKTANSALNRIRNSFQRNGYIVKTSFIGAAIALAMAKEIYSQLQDGTLSNAANLTKNDQLIEYCNWLIDL